MSERPTIDELIDAGYGPTDTRSATRRRTIRQKADIGRGIHPATRLALADNGQTCKSCFHSVRTGARTRTYWKCDLMPVTAGVGSDIRIGWPACTKWEDRG